MIFGLHLTSIKTVCTSLIGKGLKYWCNALSAPSSLIVCAWHCINCCRATSIGKLVTTLDNCCSC